MLRKSVLRYTLSCILLLMMFSATALAANPQKEWQAVRDNSVKILDRLYKYHPSAQYVIDHSYGYATMGNTGIKIGIFGGSHGRGLAVNNVTGKEVFMRMEEMSAGFGLGVKEYDLIFVFGTEAAWKAFTSGTTKFGGDAAAAAKDGFNGDSIEGAVIVSEGIWVYQMTTKGLALELSIKGTKFYPDKKLNNL